MIKPFVCICASFLSVILLVSMGAKIPQIEANKATATVNSVDGYLIFTYCKPVAGTNYLGTVNVPKVISDKAGERLQKLIKLIKKDFPKAEGLIIADDFSKADAITFKDEK